MTSPYRVSGCDVERCDPFPSTSYAVEPMLLEGVELTAYALLAAARSLRDGGAAPTWTSPGGDDYWAVVLTREAYGDLVKDSTFQRMRDFGLPPGMREIDLGLTSGQAYYCRLSNVLIVLDGFEG